MPHRQRSSINTSTEKAQHCWIAKNLVISWRASEQVTSSTFEPLEGWGLLIKKQTKGH